MWYYSIVKKEFQDIIVGITKYKLDLVLFGVQ